VRKWESKKVGKQEYWEREKEIRARKKKVRKQKWREREKERRARKKKVRKQKWWEREKERRARKKKVRNQKWREREKERKERKVESKRPRMWNEKYLNFYNLFNKLWPWYFHLKIEEVKKNNQFSSKTSQNHRHIWTADRLLHRFEMYIPRCNVVAKSWGPI
jgi:hypothetical protein